MMSELNIYQRLNAVRNGISYVKKDAAAQGYMAVTHDAVTSELRPLLIQEGVIVVPRLISSAVRDTGTTTSKGTPFIRYEAWFEVDFVNIDDPEQKVTMPIESHALDQGDKAPGKAISYATKYALLKIFNIETGENDEGRAEQKPKPYTEDQRIIFNRLIESSDQLGFYLFGRSFQDFKNQNLEGWTSLNSDYLSTIQRGGKGKEKERLGEMEEIGRTIHENITNAIEANDSFALAENMEGASEYTKKLLWHSLTAEERETAKKLMETQHD